MKVKVDTLPETEGIKNILSQIDFTDTFSTTNHVDTIEAVTKLVFGTMPPWIAFLMKLRNKIVSVFGLKTEMPDDYNVKYTVGGYIGFFQIFSIEPNEIILGADDSHLNFRVSVHNNQQKEFNIQVSTLVQYNNSFGKFYMAIVKPFHHIVVKQMVKQAYKESV